MAKTNEPATDSPQSKAEALVLAEEAEAAAIEAEALAAAARARAHAARLRHHAQTMPDDFEQDVPDATVETTRPEPASTSASWQRRLPLICTIAKAVSVAAILAFISVSVYLVWQHNDAVERQQRTAFFLAGAKQGVINMTSLDFSKAKRDVQRVIDSSTGEFRDDFQQRANDFTKVVEQSKAVTEGTINAAGVESMDKNSALVLISATSRITNSTGVKEEPQVWRLRVTVTEDGGQYKMSKVEFVP